MGNLSRRIIRHDDPQTPKVDAAPKAIAAPEQVETSPPKRRGNGDAKKLISIRVDPEVLACFKAAGEGWQSRMNEALRKSVGL